MVKLCNLCQGRRAMLSMSVLPFLRAGAFSTVLAADGNLEIPTVYIGIYNGDIEIGSNQVQAMVL